MQVYLVGGAVRDRLLGIVPKERDWVVVGVNAQALLDQAYTPVGKDFPVFLHPETKEEYALARIERKTGKGYTGFECEANETVTLEEDLKRRDLTINAMAEDENGQIIDPYGGQEDLKAKQLRHVSAAFHEDPLRVLRAARFAAQLPGFVVADETQSMMTSMAASGELAHLVAERVWQELSKALLSALPQRFVEVLAACGAWQLLFPEAEGCVDIVSQGMVHAASAGLTLKQRFAAGFGAVLSAHELKSLQRRLRPPKACMQLAVLVCRHQSQIQQSSSLDAEQVVDLFDQCDIWRRLERWQALLGVCVALGLLDAQGVAFFEAAHHAALSVDVAQVATDAASSSGGGGSVVASAVRAARIAGVRSVCSSSI